jgi:hypothetical protein
MHPRDRNEEKERNMQQLNLYYGVPGREQLAVSLLISEDAFVGSYEKIHAKELKEFLAVQYNKIATHFLDIAEVKQRKTKRIFLHSMYVGKNCENAIILYKDEDTTLMPRILSLKLDRLTTHENASTTILPIDARFAKWFTADTLESWAEYLLGMRIGKPPIHNMDVAFNGIEEDPARPLKCLTNYLRYNLIVATYNAARAYYCQIWQESGSNPKKLDEKINRFNNIFHGVVQIQPNLRLSSFGTVYQKLNVLPLLEPTVEYQETLQYVLNRLLTRCANADDGSFGLLSKALNDVSRMQFKNPITATTSPGNFFATIEPAKRPRSLPLIGSLISTPDERKYTFFNFSDDIIAINSAIPQEDTSYNEASAANKNSSAQIAKALAPTPTFASSPKALHKSPPNTRAVVEPASQKIVKIHRSLSNAIGGAAIGLGIGALVAGAICLLIFTAGITIPVALGGAAGLGAMIVAGMLASTLLGFCIGSIVGAVKSLRKPTGPAPREKIIIPAPRPINLNPAAGNSTSFNWRKKPTNLTIDITAIKEKYRK